MSTPMTLNLHASPEQVMNRKREVLLLGQDESVTVDVTKTTEECEKLRKQYNELQEEFRVYRVEKKENEKIVNEQVEKFRHDNSKLRLKAEKLANQLEFNGERFKTLQLNSDGYQKEIAAMRDRNTKLSAAVVKHEQLVATLREEVKVALDAQSRAEVRVEHLRNEKEVLKCSEARLSQEKESWMREQSMHKMVVTNLELIQNNLERAEFETKNRLMKRVEELDKENMAMRRRLDNADNQNRTVVATLERQVTEMRGLRDRESAQLTRAREDLQTTQAEVVDLRAQLSRAEATLSAAETRLASLSVSDVPPGGAASRQLAPGTDPMAAAATREQQLALAAKNEEVKDLKAKMVQFTEEMKGLQNALEQSKKHESQYKKIAQGVEENLKEQNEQSKMFLQDAENRLKEREGEIGQLQGELDKVKFELENAKSEQTQVEGQTDDSNLELRKQLETLQTVYEEAIGEQESAIANEKAARADSAAHAQSAQEYQERYQKELVQHAADVEQLEKVKVELGQIEQEISNSRQEAQRAKDALEIYRSSTKEASTLLQEDKNKLEKSVEELKQQNSLLHSEVEQISEKMVALQTTVSRDQDEAKQLAETVALQSEPAANENLLQVVKYLRKEKEITEAKLDVIQAECARYKSRSEHLNKEVEDARTSLEREREQAQALVQTNAQHADLMNRVEQLNLLQESNRALRADKVAQEAQMRAAEEKSTQLETAHEPLHMRINELEATGDALQAERAALKNEVQRWKDRVNGLIEKYNKIEPEEVKKLISDKDELEKVNKGLVQDKQKVNAALLAAKSAWSAIENKLNQQLKETKDAVTKANATNTNLTEQIKTMQGTSVKVAQEVKVKEDQLRQELAKAEQNTADMKNELDKAKEDFAKESESHNKQKTLNSRLHKLGIDLRSKNKKLEAHVTAVDIELAELKKAKTEGEGEAKQEINTELNAKKAVIEKLEKELQAAKESFDTTVNTFKVQNLELTNQIKDLQKELEEKSKQSAAVGTAVDNKEVEELQRKLTENEGMMGKMKGLIGASKERLSKLRADVETKEKEREDFAKKNAELQQQLESIQNETEQLKASSEGQIQELQGRLESELLAANQRDDDMKTSLDAANQRISLLQSQLETRHKATVVAVGPERTNVSESPATAHIRPMASTTARTQGSVTSRGVGADSRATASIRPIPASPAQTRTATVMPTPAHEPDVSPVTQTVRPLNLVQPVSPQGAEETATASMAMSQSSVPSATATMTSSATVTVVMAQPGKRHREESGEPGPSTSGETSQKRPRVSSIEERRRSAETGVVQPQVRETQEEQQIAAITPQQQTASETTATITAHVQPQPRATSPAQGPPVVEVAPQAQAAETEHAAATVQATSESMDAESEQLENVAAEFLPVDDVTMQEDAADNAAGVHLDESQANVIVEDSVEIVENDAEDDIEEVEEGVDVQEEIDEVEDEEEDDDEHEIEVEPREHYVEDVGQDEGDAEEFDEDDDIERDTDGSEDDTEDNIQIEHHLGDAEEDEDDDDFEESEVEDEAERDVGSSDDDVVVLDDSDSNPQTTPESHLASSRLAPLDTQDHDEGIVPSTPTLPIPRRTDGFAEGVTSPGQSNFVFGAGDAADANVARLASQQGVDDSKLDLGIGGQSETREEVEDPDEDKDELELDEEENVEEEEDVGLEKTAAEFQPTTSAETSLGEQQSISTIVSARSSSPTGGRRGFVRTPIVWESPTQSTSQQGGRGAQQTARRSGRSGARSSRGAPRHQGGNAPPPLMNQQFTMPPRGAGGRGGGTARRSQRRPR